MKKLLFQLDTDAIANAFDTIVGYDGGADDVIRVAGMTPANVGHIVDGAIFTRPPSLKKTVALFVTGSRLDDGQALFDAIGQHFFGKFRVSTMLDSNGANTTSAAAVAYLDKLGKAAGKRVVILAGTGPVGQRCAVLLAKLGASILVTSRRRERAAAACAAMKRRFGVELEPAVANDAASMAACLDGAHVAVSTGATGVQILSEELWATHPTLECLMDANATPPLGIAGIEMDDRGAERHGKICYGALGFGSLKLEIHRSCIAKMFQTNELALDALEIFELGREILTAH